LLRVCRKAISAVVVAEQHRAPTRSSRPLRAAAAWDSSIRGEREAEFLLDNLKTRLELPV
jgi:hypothetical protein